MGSPDLGKMAYLDGKEQIVFKEYEIPEVEPEGVLTEVEQANICGSDLHIWRGDHPEVTEGVIGHEGVCRIVERGSKVKTDFAGETVETGDLVTPVYFVHCQECNACLEGQYNLCQNAYEHFTKPPDVPPHFHGTFSTHYYIHPKQHFYKVPDGVEPGVAAAANCGLSQMLYGLDLVGVSHDDTVVVQGAGGLGLNALAIAREKGAEVIVIEAAEKRIERARDFGAHHIINFQELETVEAREQRVREITDGVGADIGVEVAGVPEAFTEGIRLLRDGGQYLEVGNVTPGRTTEFDPGHLTRKSVQITPVVRYEPRYLKRALDFLSTHGSSYPYNKLIDETFELEDIESAFHQSSERSVTRAGVVHD